MTASDPPFAVPRFKCVLDEATEMFEEAAVCLQSSRQVPGSQGSGPDVCISNVLEDSNSTDMASMPHGALQGIYHAIGYMEYLCKSVTDLDGKAMEALRHDRFRTALLQLLAVLVRLDNLLLPPVQESRVNAHSHEQQLLPDEGGPGEHANATHGAGLAPEGAMRCAMMSIFLITDLLRVVSIPLWCSNAGSGTAAGVGCGSSGSSGPAADASSAAHQLVLGLELGCVLLRMHTLQCCSRQVAAVCAWMGGSGEEQEGEPERQQQPQQDSQQQQAHGEQQGCTELRKQLRKQQSREDETLNTVSAILDVTSGLMSLARAALTVLRADGTPSAGFAADAAAAAGQHADCRKLARRFLLLLASNLRDSHLLEHCARATVVAAVWQGQGSARQEAGGGESCPQGLLGLLQAFVQAIGGAEHLLPSCERAPAPASTVVGPAVRQALTGPGVVHLASILGLRALCTADGGPDYGMPVSYRAVPAEYGRWQAGCQEPYSREQHVLTMTGVLGNTPPPADLAQAQREVGERLVLLLRACDVAVASAVGHGGGRGGREEEQRVGGGGGGGRAGDGLRHALASEVLMQICFGALWAGSNLLDVCWELVETAGAPRPLGDGVVQAGAGSAGEVSSGVTALTHSGQVTGAAAAVATGTAAAAAAATQVPAPVTDGPSAGSSRQLAVEQPPAGRRKALSLAALRAHEMRWWRRMCAAVTHVLPVAWRLPSYSEGTATEQEFAFAAWLGLEKMELPDCSQGERCLVACLVFIALTLKPLARTRVLTC